jgi:acyl-CoA synthetase (NDP forming)
VYGFTYSPALMSAPLFRVRRYRSFEIHKLPDGEIAIVGFVSEEEASQLADVTADEVAVKLQPEPEAGADALVVVPYSRIRRHRQYSVRTDHGLALTVAAVSQGRDLSALSE